MTRSAIHPAMLQLLWLQSRGRRRRMWRRFRQPRRLILSLVAGLLAILWLGNAALTVWLRESASPGTLGAYLSLGLALYAAWHFAQAAFFRPETPFEWSEDQREMLAAMPLLPRDLVAYQLASVTVTTTLKAGLFTLLLAPDLRCLPLGFIGLMLAMFALEVLRLAVDISTWGIGRRSYLAYRTVVIAGLVAAGFTAGALLIRENAFARINLGEGLLDRAREIIVQLDGSVFGYLALPLRPLVDLTLAEHMTPKTVALAVVAMTILTGAAGAVIVLYSRIAARVTRRERHDYERNSKLDQQTAAARIHSTSRAKMRLLRQIPHCVGVGPLAWRQLLGARRHWGSLLAAMIAPAILSLMPCLVIADPYIAFLSTMATLAFYTFLLLPTALRFDFRRDLDRLAVLKSLPIASTAAAIGQTLAPVLIATLFQTAVLTTAAFARSLPPHILAAAVLVMVPLNVLVFALDNVIYLLYPYRIQQEGLEIFLRTMLTFTGKGLLFAAGLTAMAAWGFASATLTRGLARWSGFPIDAYVVFTLGMIVGPAMLATFLLYVLSRTYRHMDPIEGVPR